MYQIGDYILTTLFIRGIRQNYPNANIILVVSPLVYNLAKTNQYVNEIYIFDGSMDYRVTEFALIEVIQFCYKNLWFKNDQFRQIDIAFSPQCGSDNFLPLLLSYFSGAARRIGYGSNPFIACRANIEELTNEQINSLVPNFFIDNFILTDSVLITNKEVHEVEKYIYLLKVFNLKLDNDDLDLIVTDEAINNMKQYINKDKKNIIVNIGASQLCAVYDIEKLNQALKLIDALNLTDNNYIFVGGVNDIKRMKYITVPHINMVGKTSLQEMAALIKLSNLYIGNDSGAMHMAAVFKIPVIEISREAKDKTKNSPKTISSIYRFHPWRTKYIVIQPNTALDKCKDIIIYSGCASEFAHCINQIEPEDIKKAFIDIIS